MLVDMECSGMMINNAVSFVCVWMNSASYVHTKFYGSWFATQFKDDMMEFAFWNKVKLLSEI